MIFLNDINQLKKDIYTSKKDHFYNLIDQADSYHNWVLSVTPPKESTTYFCQAILNLSLAYLLTEDEKYLLDVKRFIKTVCEYPYWGNAHLVNVDLSASWIMFGLSLAYNWLSEAFDQDFKKMILDKLILQSNIMYDYKQEKSDKGWPTNYYQNHNWINLTGLAACGYAIKNEYPEAVKYIEDAKENFKIVFNLLPEDGSDYEGVVYWRYGVYWLLVYAELLKNQEGFNYFENCDFLKNTFYYRFYQSASELKKHLNFGDCHDRYSGHSAAMYYKFASEYNDGYAQKYANMVSRELRYEEQYSSKVKPGILPEAWLELLWYNPQVEEKEYDSLPLVKKFDDLGLITIRNNFGPESTVVSFKCGYPGGKKQWLTNKEYYLDKGRWIASLSHHHPDNTSFILTKGHSYMVIDEGYNRNIMPKHHNVLLVDGKYTDAIDCNDVYVQALKNRLKDNHEYPIEKYYGEVKHFNTFDQVVTFKMNNTNLYPLDLKMKEVSRFVLTNALKYIVLIDKFESEEKHIYSSVFNTDVRVKKVSENKYSLKNGLESLYFNINSTNEIDVAHEKDVIKSVMTTQEPDKIMVQDLNNFIISNSEASNDHIQITVLTFEDMDIEFNEKYIKLNDEEIIHINQNEFIYENKSINFEKRLEVNE